MNNPKYPMELFLRVITVSLETMKIVDGCRCWIFRAPKPQYHKTP